MLLSGCQRDYRFHTVAVYEAPLGRYLIRIEGEGVVRAGHDLSQQASGRLTVFPSSGPLLGIGPAASRDRSPVPVAIAFALRGSQVHYGDDLQPDGTPPEPGLQVLSRLLSTAGYAVHADELEELVSAAEGVLLGPKGTLMAGQSRTLRVVSTTFQR